MRNLPSWILSIKTENIKDANQMGKKIALLQKSATNFERVYIANQFNICAHHTGQ